MAAPSQAHSTLRRRVVRDIRSAGSKAECVLADQTRIRISSLLAGFVRPGDEVECDLLLNPDAEVPEIRVIKALQSARWRDLYDAPIGYVTRPKADKRGELFLRAEVPSGRLGISAIHLSNQAVRNYFYSIDRRGAWSQGETLYELLHGNPSASLSDLRLAFRVRQLELELANAPKSVLRALERAFNILGNPELRSCYDALLTSPDALALFPYGGFGSILVSGEISRDRRTFFAHRILSFLPERHQRRFRVALRRIEFYDDRAFYRESRRKVEVLLDPNLLPLGWDTSWNRWKHLLGAKIGIEATFVKSGCYRLRSGEWQLLNWKTALPSRINVDIPGDIQEAVETAKRTYDRFGRYSAALDQIRERIEQQPVEKSELNRLCGELAMPGDFDVAQITWRPDYNLFFYRELCRRARRLYLFRNEYIFDLHAAVVVEVPQLGHATYLFAKPRSLDKFVTRYAATTKEEIRRNRDNVAESLGFLGRIIHGSNPKRWLHELRVRIGERPTEY